MIRKLSSGGVRVMPGTRGSREGCVSSAAALPDRSKASHFYIYNLQMLLTFMQNDCDAPAQYLRNPYTVNLCIAALLEAVCSWLASRCLPLLAIEAL